MDEILQAAQRVIETGAADIYYDASFDSVEEIEAGGSVAAKAVEAHLEALSELTWLIDKHKEATQDKN